MTHKYTVQQIETLGTKCKFQSMGAERDGWIMPDGFGVDYAGFGQLTFDPESIATLDQVGLMRARVATASKLLLEHYSTRPSSQGEVWLEQDGTMLLTCSANEASRLVTLVLTVKFQSGAASWRSANLTNLTDALDTDEQWRPSYSEWRHGGWYVTNVRYPSGAIGCVSNNYEDGKWRIACDPRREGLNEPGDFTFITRDAAARAERELVRIEALSIQAVLASTPPKESISFAGTINAAAA